MKRILFFIFFVFSSSVFSQLPNLNPSTKDDAFLLDYFFNKQQNSSNNRNSTSLFNDNDMYYLGKNNGRDFFISKSSIKKDDLWISFLLISNTTFPRYINNQTYFSTVDGFFISCSGNYFLRRLSSSYYSEENFNGKLVFEDDRQGVVRKENIDKDLIYSNVKKYLCR